MIRIGKPFTKTEDGRAYLCAPVDISDDTAARYLEVTAALKNTAWLTADDYPPAAWKEEGIMWFSAPGEYRDHFCTERSNAFVIALFWYAMITSSDIRFEAPLSKKLYDGLTQSLIPALSRDGYGGISIDGPVTSEPVWNDGGVVTGMSCGVDSMYTLHCYGGENAPDGLRLTHLVYYDGNYLLPYTEPPYDLNEIYSTAGAPHAYYVEHARVIAGHHGLPLIHVKNNIDRDYYRGARIFSSMYRFLACTLALEHLYGTYISSSSGHSEGIEVSLFVPTQHYEDLICESCRTETLSYVSSDHELRSGKLRALADDADAQDYLAVCYQPGPHGENCGECYACWKTMIPLDIINKLGAFGNSFDLRKYYSGRRKVFSDLIRFSMRPEATSARDSVRQFMSLAEKEQNEAGREFIEEYNCIMREE